MFASAKAMTVTTVVALIVVSAYSAALGGNGWLWFLWLVLGMVTLGIAAVQER